MIYLPLLQISIVSLLRPGNRGAQCRDRVLYKSTTSIRHVVEDLVLCKDFWLVDNALKLNLVMFWLRVAALNQKRECSVRASPL